MNIYIYIYKHKYKYIFIFIYLITYIMISWSVSGRGVVLGAIDWGWSGR